MLLNQFVFLSYQNNYQILKKFVFQGEGEISIYGKYPSKIIFKGGGGASSAGIFRREVGTSKETMAIIKDMTVVESTHLLYERETFTLVLLKKVWVY